ncbi:tyrosine-type recombinase/integrase [Bacillus cereus]|uniref:tyrosine-type recombinase/integrase n=1 Tax=Bacillus cereus TaxID=1396 RepID=UPI003012E39A
MISNAAYTPEISPEKKEQILQQLQGYLMNDVWDLRDNFFEVYDSKESWGSNKKRIDFTSFSFYIQQELKYFFAKEIVNRSVTIGTLLRYSVTFKYLSDFLNKQYPNIHSFIELPYERGLIKYKSYLINRNVNITNSKGQISSKAIAFFNRAYQFLFNFYDIREEFEKDIWDIRNIPNVRYSKSKAEYRISFHDIHPSYREAVKKYAKFTTVSRSFSSLQTILRGIKHFIVFLQKYYTNWNSITDLQRSHIEQFLLYVTHNLGHLSEGTKADYLYGVKVFIDYLQRTEHPKAPTTPVFTLFFKEDFPKQRRWNENEIKYIPDSVMSQLELLLIHNPDELNPPMKDNDKKYIPVIILLMATGWRISDILNIRYYNCLITDTNRNYYLQGDIPKTDVKQHRIPIDKDVALIVQAVIEQTKNMSTTENNPDRYLFVHTKGKRKGNPFCSGNISRALNRLAKRYNIMDQDGSIYHFRNHAFRHTKGVELINLGMNLTHIMKWFAHSTPEMTLVYAKIADDTLRREWEKAQEKKGPLLRVNLDNGQVNEMAMDEDLIHWEYIRSNIEAIRVPLGFCLASKKEGCPYVVTPCLTCPNFCTTPDNLCDFEREIRRVEEHIQMTQDYPIYNEKTKEQLDNLVKIRDQLVEGKSHRGESAKKILFDAQITKEKGVSS